MTGRRFGRDEHPEELLSASLSGDLSASERSALDAHLAGCGRCRATLQAFAEERHLVAGLREVPPPRDLAARVRAGIEGRSAALPWWRRPSTLVAGFASLATVAAALLAVVVLSGVPRGGVGNATPTASTSAAASVAETPTLEPSESGAPSPQATSEPTTRPAVALAPGELGYLSLDGEPQSPLALSFVNEDRGEVSELGEVAGPPVASAISPTGEFLAYITELGLSGVNQVALVRLSDGVTEVLGCTAPWQFTDRLAWSDDGRFLAYTLSPVDLGDSADCGGVTGDGSTIDAWVYDAGAAGEAVQMTEAGNAFAADFLRTTGEEGEYKLLVSYAGVQPYSEPILLSDGQSIEAERVNAFMPLLSSDGQRALFWRGEMAPSEGGGWRIERGGMPYVTGEPVDGQPSWSGEPLFADLQPVGGEGFQAGAFTWGSDSDQLAFWGGQWTGAPQSDDGRYPSDGVYVGRVSAGLLGRDSRVSVELVELQRLTSVALAADGNSLLATAVQPAAGDMAVPSASLLEVPLDGASSKIVGIGAAWTGPAVIGEEAVRLTP